MVDFIENLQFEETRVYADIGEAGEVLESNSLLNVVHFNIRSIRKHFDELLVYLQMLKLEKIDVIVLSECWNITNKIQFSIDGYELFSNDSHYNKNDGLLVYVKSRYRAEIEVVNFSETNVLRLRLDVEGINCGVTASYRPPSTNIRQYIRDLNEYFIKTEVCGMEIFIGDINIDISNNLNQMSIDYESCLGEHGFRAMINETTRKTELTKSIIDHVCVRVDSENERKLAVSAGIIQSSITDHYPIMININSPVNYDKEVIQREPINVLNYEKLNSYLVRENWGSVMSACTPQEAYSKFIGLLQKYIRKSQLVKHVKSKTVKKIQPWITEEIIRLIKQRDKMKKELTKNYSIEKKVSFNKFRNQLIKKIRITKDNYYRERIDMAGNCTRKIWQTINEINNRSSHKNCIPIEIIDEEGNYIRNDVEKANEFNKFFINIGKKMCDNIGNLTPLKTQQTNSHSIYLQPITHEEIVVCIASLKNNSSPGPDNITAKLLKNIHCHILDPLSHIFNSVLETGIVPEEWKNTHVICAFKSGNKKKMTNYRPITLINNIPKIFEKCLKTRLMAFFNKFKLLSSKQYGFREGLSTVDAMEVLIERTLNTLNDKKKIAAVFLDLAKAFDTVDHRLLVERLERLGIRGVCLKLLKNYLCNRIQRVKIGSVLSQPLQINMGIPQGTVIGPTLFLVFINELLCIPNLEINSYADDSVILFCGDTWDHVYEEAVRGMRSVYAWLKNSKLKLNIDKTKFITFSLTTAGQPDFDSIPVHSQCCTSINCDCQAVAKESSIKYLGVYIDQFLRWDVHVENMIKKMKGLVYIFYNLRNVLDENMLLRVYEALVLSILRYGLPIWGGMFKCYLNSIQVIQNSILKIIHGVGVLYNTNELFNETRQLKFEQLYIYECILRQIKKNVEPVQHNYVTRYASNHSIPIPRLYGTHLQHSFLYNGAKFYDSLPIQFKVNCNPRQKGYKNRLKVYIMENPERFVRVLTC